MRRAGLCLLVAVVAGACGPLEYGNDVARHATDAVDTARRANAEKLAPYWWTRAVQYLHEARELAGYADFQAANRFGRLARESAEHATADATAAPHPTAAEPAIAPLAPAKNPADAPLAPAKDTP